MALKYHCSAVQPKDPCVREYHWSHPAGATHFGYTHFGYTHFGYTRFGNIQLGFELLPNAIGHAFEVDVFG